MALRVLNGLIVTIYCFVRLFTKYQKFLWMHVIHLPAWLFRVVISNLVIFWLLMLSYYICMWLCLVLADVGEQIMWLMQAAGVWVIIFVVCFCIFFQKWLIIWWCTSLYGVHLVKAWLEQTNELSYIFKSD